MTRQQGCDSTGDSCIRDLDGKEGRKEERSILSKRPRQRLLTADLLPADERINRDRDGAVDVLRSAVFGQTHFAESFADAHDGF